MKLKIGHAHDIHRLVEGRKLFLGGLEIEHYYGLDGHSDADVLLHAITESIIGALGRGDIGTFFPDTDPQYKGADSKLLLADIVKVMEEDGYAVNNVDATIYLELPKMRPHMERICEIIANILHVERNQVNIKATRGEKLGFVGREEGIAAESVVLLTKND